MIRSLLTILFSIILLPASLSATTPLKTAKHTVRKINSVVVPQGERKWYTMDAYVQTGQGTVMYYGLSNEICFAPDGHTVYFRTLFPANYRELWVKGIINGNTITIDHNEVIATDRVVFDEGPVELSYKVGEAVFDVMDNLVDVKDIVFKIDGDRIYIEDDMKEPDRAIALYCMEEGEPDLYDWTFCDSFKPYTGATEVVTPPATATVKSYVYEYKDRNLKESTDIRRIANDGNDYYFEGLVPTVGGWTKGTRNGNTISISRAQLLKFDPQILKIAGYRSSEGGRLSDFSFAIDEKGVITQNDGDNQFIVCYQTNGSLFDYGKGFILTPYDDSKALMPYNPAEVHSVYYDELKQHGIEFMQYPSDADGNLISVEQLGYYIYVNGKRFMFTKEQYPYLGWSATDFIPFGYCDDYNNGDIFNDGYYNVVLFYIDDYDTLGVQSVYRAGGIETRSDIITVNKANVVDIVPDGIAAPTLDSSYDDIVYDLYGRRSTGIHRGVKIIAGKKIISI